MNKAEKERLIKKDIESINNRVRHAFNQGYELGLKAYKEQSGDAISRQAVIELCDVRWLDDFAAEVRALPSVTPQQRTGRWIDDEFGSKCSCCGNYTHLDKFNRPMKFKCCSMCGAKMEE